MGKAEINTPDEDVDIGYDFTGHVRCRHLTILEGGTVSGTVVAHRIDVKGSLFGVADCEYFQALPPAVVRGTVFSPKYFTRDREDREADVVALHMSTRQHIFRELPRQPLPAIDEVITDAIEQAVAETLAASVLETPAAERDGIASSDMLGRSAGAELSLSERLASKGLTSLIPAAEEAPPTLPASASRQDQSSRMPLPSLV